MLTPPPLMNAVTKNLPSCQRTAKLALEVDSHGMADSQVHIMVVVKPSIVTNPKRRYEYHQPGALKERCAFTYLCLLPYTQLLHVGSIPV